MNQGWLKQEHIVPMIVWGVAAICALAVAVIVIFDLRWADFKTSSKPVTELESSGPRSVTRKFFGCQDREYFLKLTRYLSDKDNKAFEDGLGVGALTGQCTTFQAGDKVFLADTAFMSGLKKIRKRGETAEYWTISEIDR